MNTKLTKTSWNGRKTEFEGMIASPSGKSEMMVLNQFGYNGVKLGGKVQIHKIANVYYFPGGSPIVNFPFLLMTETEFNLYQDVVHSGAFGSPKDGYEIGVDLNSKKWQITGLLEDAAFIQKQTWCIVWKIPGDMNTDSTWRALQDVNVNKYSLIASDWCSIKPSNADVRKTLKKKGINIPEGATKWRSDKKVKGNYTPLSTSVHHLGNLKKDSRGKDGRLAMISSLVVFADWSPSGITDDEKARVNTMAEWFWKNHKIAVWNAFVQHAIVFSVTPEDFADLIEDQHVFKAIADAALGPKHANRGMWGGLTLNVSALAQWRANYIEKYGRKTASAAPATPLPKLKRQKNWRHSMRVSPEELKALRSQSSPISKRQKIHDFSLEREVASRPSGFLKNVYRGALLTRFEMLDRETRTKALTAHVMSWMKKNASPLDINDIDSLQTHIKTIEMIAYGADANPIVKPASMYKSSNKRLIGAQSEDEEVVKTGAEWRTWLLMQEVGPAAKAGKESKKDADLLLSLALKIRWLVEVESKPRIVG
jgi:hypothetical protein